MWFVSGAKGVLTRIDRKTNKISAEVTVPAGSVAAYYSEGAVWVAANKSAKLVRVDARKNTVLKEIKVGPEPPFLTAGGGSVWTVNQGAGSVTRADAKSSVVLARIDGGIPGGGGLWMTMFDIPITFIDAKTNQVTKQ